MTEQWKRLDEALPREIRQEDAFISTAETFWNGLSSQDQLKCFFSVVDRIYTGTLEDNQSYREILSETFGFDNSSYNIGLLCGFLTIYHRLNNTSEIDDDVYQSIMKTAEDMYENENFSLNRDQTVIVEKDFSWYVAQATARYLNKR